MVGAGSRLLRWNTLSEKPGYSLESVYRREKGTRFMYAKELSLVLQLSYAFPEISKDNTIAGLGSEGSP